MSDPQPSPANESTATSAKTSRKLTTRGQLSQEKVIKAGLDCIAEMGFHGASTNKIAEHAGVTWGTLQHLFGDKVTLLEALMVYAFQQQATTMGQSINPQATLADRVDELIDTLWDIQFSSSTIALDDIVRGVLSDVDMRNRLLPTLQDIRDQHNLFWQGLFSDIAIDPEHFETAKQFTLATIRGLAADRSLRSSDTAILAAREQLKHWLVQFLQNHQ